MPGGYASLRARVFLLKAPGYRLAAELAVADCAPASLELDDAVATRRSLYPVAHEVDVIQVPR